MKRCTTCVFKSRHEQQNLFFHFSGSLFPFIFPLFLAALGSSRRPRGGAGGEKGRKTDRASESREEVDIQRETPRPPARHHPANLTDVLRTHCSIACKIDTLAYL